MYKLLLTIVVVVCLAGITGAATDDEGFAGPAAVRVQLASQALDDLKQVQPDVKVYRTGQMATRLYGPAFGSGSSPIATAEQFRLEHAGVFGVSSDDLVMGAPWGENLQTQQIMYNEETGEYKFTLVYYAQYHQGLPVHQAELRLLVRNEPGYPLVLAASSLRDLDGFTADMSRAVGHSVIAEQAASVDEVGLDKFGEQTAVVWAGINDNWTQARQAVVFEGSSDFPEKFQFVIDGVTGEIIHKQNLIIFEDVVGNVSGMATPGPKSMECTPSVLTPFPYALVNISGGGSTYTDSDGDYTIANGGTVQVSVTSAIQGEFFYVTNYVGSEESLTLDVTPPGPADFVHNSADAIEQVRAQVNGYVNANEVRDFTLAANPTYPTIYLQTGFPVSVNRTDGYCPGNAWYDGSSINFCQSSSSYGNTSFASVSQHEYGHHLVATGGSGQDQYGEGMGDCVAMLIADDPGLGYGFFLNQCNTPLRNANNSMQYPCSGAIHDCGQLLSGCVWSTRNEMIVTEPTHYLTILRNLTINSILLHIGGTITPQITIDFLTLDDLDGNINNGTPHYYEIAAGFGAHNMDAPEITPLEFTYPIGIPSMLTPDVPTTFQVVVTGVGGETPVSGTGRLWYSIDGGSTVEVEMTETSPNNYDAVLPAVPCYSVVKFYVGADLQGGGTFYDPIPSSPNSAVAATGSTLAFEDDFQTNLGWTVSGNATDGQWGRGVPIGGGDRGDPPSDFDGSGYCYLTDNVDGNSDVDGGTTILTSPTIDLSWADNAMIHYARWYSNIAGDDPNNDEMYVYISNDDGGSWTLAETVGPVLQSSGGWYVHEFFVTEFVTPTAQIKLRFDVGDLSAGSIVEAALDDFKVVAYACGLSQPAILTVDLPDWTAGVPYSQTLQAGGGSGTLTWSDLYGDLVGTGLTLSGAGLLSGTPTSGGTITFTAQVEDDSSLTDSKLLGFDVNDAVEITTTTVPDGVEGEVYSTQLVVAGGTGGLTVTDKNGDLAGSGLTLSTSGLLSGTPNSVGDLSFTARADDAIGGYAEMPLVLHVAAPWICGDVNGSGADPDVEDLTYLVAYLFTGGPPPPELEAADMDADGEVLVTDLTILVNYLFTGGPSPVCP